MQTRKTAARLLRLGGSVAPAIAVFIGRNMSIEMRANGRKENMQYGLQLYSVRDVVPADYQSALRQVAQMGYAMVETCDDFKSPTAAQVKGWCDANGLTVSGTHTGAEALASDVIEQTIRNHHTLGCSLLIIPGHDLTTREKLDDFIALVERARPMLEKEGITLAYHNHSHEFYPNEDGQIIYDELLSRTGLKLELDTYWAYNARQDVISLMEKLRGRLVAVHLKDGDAQGNGFPLGQGTPPVVAVRRKAIEMGVRMVVESETLQPDGLTEAKACIDFLKTLDD